jgi:flagellar export protein FliJ
MKRFKYSLQRVLDVREVAVTRCEATLAGSERSLQVKKSEESRCHKALRQAAETVGDKTKPNLVLPSHECIAERAWLEHLSDRVHRAAHATQKQIATVDAHRRELAKAMLDHKVIENLSHRERAEWLENVRIAEQKSMDEIASQTIERRKRSATQGSRAEVGAP